MTPSRRELLKAAALAAATGVASRAQAEDGVDPELRARLGDGVRWDKAPCRFCGTGCHVQVGVEGGKVVAVAGDRLADVNKGLLCMKGYHVGLALYGQDRLTTPLYRENGRLVPISWERAIELIADRIALDPAGFGFYGSGQWTIPEGYAAQKFMKGGLGNNHIDPNARLCMASAVTGFLATYGVDEPNGCYQDLDEADVVLAWGNNPAEMHPVLFSRFLDRKSRGEPPRLIDLTTRRTRTSAHADRTVLFRPNTDLAVVNGILHLLARDGSWDRAFVEANCAFRAAEPTEPTLQGMAISQEDWQGRQAPYTPEEVARISGVSVEDLRYLADLFADRSLRITSLWCMGANQHTRGTAINALLHALHLFSGHFGRPGDNPTSLTGQPSACGTAREVGTLAHALPGGLVVTKDEHRRIAEEIWNVPEGRISGKPGLHTLAMFESWCSPRAQGGLHTLWVQVTNPGQTLPNRHKLFEPGVRDPDKMLIVSDVYPTATTEGADLILPSALWVEKNGMYGNSERRTQQWFKMVEPPGQAREDLWQILAVARALFERGHPGMVDREGRFLFRVTDAQGAEVPVWNYERFHDVNVDEALFEEYRRFTTFKHKNLAPYAVYAAHRGLRWPVVEQEDGSWRETRYRFSRFDDPFVAKDREHEFYHSTSGDGRAQIWFHPYEPAPEEPDQDFPLWLCTGRVIEHWHSGTLTGRIPQLRAAMPQAYLEMNRRDADQLGISNGEVVVLETRRGRLELPVWIDGRGAPPEGSVFVPFFDERLLINDLTLDAHDPFSKQPDYKKCAARVRRRAP